MAKNTAIEWADSTFNPWVGCTKVSPGCDHCYAESWAKRAGKAAGVTWGGARRRTSDENWEKPLRWNAQAEREGRRFRVFCASLADVFDNQVPPEWRTDLFRLIESTPHLDWLLLTKRVGNVVGMVPVSWLRDPGWPANVWLGATVVNQAEADRDVPKLLAVPARVRFLSIEPMLGPINLQRLRTPECVTNWGDGWHFDALTGRFFCGSEEDPEEVGLSHQLGWVICGGESGPGARPMHPDWARSLRDQCAAAGVPFLFKQWGEWLPLSHQRGGADPEERQRHMWPDGHEYDGREPMTPDCAQLSRVGKKAAGRQLYGRTHDGVPQ